jgi:hypothetical protein
LYRNETEAGTAIRESGLARSEIFVTTKFSGVDGLDIRTSIRNSLKYVSLHAIFSKGMTFISVLKLGLAYVDLYLIHWPWLGVPDIPTLWREMEEIKAQGLAKSAFTPPSPLSISPDANATQEHRRQQFHRARSRYPPRIGKGQARRQPGKS